MSTRRCHTAARVKQGSGAVAQLGERLLCKQEAVGSIPSSSTSRSQKTEDRAQNGRCDRHCLLSSDRLTSGTIDCGNGSVQEW